MPLAHNSPESRDELSCELGGDAVLLFLAAAFLWVMASATSVFTDSFARLRFLL